MTITAERKQEIVQQFALKSGGQWFSAGSNCFVDGPDQRIDRPHAIAHEGLFDSSWFVAVGESST